LNCAQFAKHFPNIPVVYLYSRRDEYVGSSDSMEIFGNLSTEFKYFIDSQAKHNECRRNDKIKRVFNLLKDLRKKKERKRKRRLAQKKLISNQRYRSKTLLESFGLSKKSQNSKRSIVKSRKMSFGGIIKEKRNKERNEKKEKQKEKYNRAKSSNHKKKKRNNNLSVNLIEDLISQKKAKQHHELLIKESNLLSLKF
jgi:hypothetical protein